MTIVISRGTPLTKTAHMIALVVLWSILGVAAAHAQVPVPRAGADTVREHLDAGGRALASRRFAEAVGHFSRAVAADPAKGEAYLSLGQAYWADDRQDSLSVERAVQAFEKAVDLDQGLATTWGRTALEQLAVAAVRSERLEIARGAFRRLLTIEQRPDLRARYETQLDEIALDQGTYAPVPTTRYGPTGEVIGPIGPLQMRTNQWFEKGRHTQDPAKAEIYYRKAIDADPVMWQSHLNYGIALARQRRFEEALVPLAEAGARWRQAYPDRPAHLRAHLWRLTAFLELGRLEGAGREVAVLTTLPDDDPWVRLYVLRYLVAVGRATPALNPLEALARENPENVEVLYALALAYRGVDRHLEARAVLRDAIRAIPDKHLTLGPWRAPLEAVLQEWQRPGGPEGPDR